MSQPDRTPSAARIIDGSVAYALHQEFPLLWEKAQEFDFAERLGGCSDPLLAEIDGAMRELWMARTNLNSLSRSSDAAEPEEAS